MLGQNVQCLATDGSWFLSGHARGAMNIFGRRSYLQWYDTQMYDVDGIEVLSKREAFGIAVLLRPADAARPGLPLKDKRRDQSTTVGLVIEYDPYVGSSTARVVVLFRSANNAGLTPFDQCI